MGDSDDEHDRSRGRDKFRRERNDYGSSDKGRSSRNDSYRDRRASWRDGGGRRRSRDDYEDDNRRRYSSGYGRGPGGGRDWSPPPAKRTRRDWESLRDYPTPGMMTPYGMRPPWPMPPPGPHPQVPPMIIPMESPNSTPQSLGRHVMLTFKQFLAQQDDTIDEMDAISSYNEYKADFKRKQVEEFFEKHKDEDWFMSLYHPTNLATAKEEASSHLHSRVEAFLFLWESGRLDQVSLTTKYTDQIVTTMDAAVIKMEGGTNFDLLSLEEEEEEDSDEEEGEKKKDDTTAKDAVQPLYMREQSEEDLKLAEKAKEYGMMRKRKTKKEAIKEEESESSALEETKKIVIKREKEDNDLDRTPEPANNSEATETQATEENSNNVDTSTDQKTPRPLHLTCSVYIRHIPPKILAEDIIKVCKTVPGFLRVAFAEASADKGYERRGWVTYSHGTDIKETSSMLGSVKVNDTLLSCSVNRELSRRVKQSPAATWTRKAVHSDLQLAIKLIKFMDEKNQLWEHAPEGDMQESNPILAIDESLLCEEEHGEAVAIAVGEEEEGAISESSSTEVLEEDDKKLKVVERLMWYLRLVHSLDYYNTVVFPSEDNMPHRCGIFTVRTKPPLSVMPEDLSRYCEDMQENVEPLLTKKKLLLDSDMEKFGQKDPESEAERFIEMNTQKLSENKYLCPLSGKKFKGPEFVKKHIFNKHLEKVEAVKKEAEFFNNYLRDHERPMPSEASLKSSVLPPNPKTPSAEESPTIGMISPLGGTAGPAAAWGQEAQLMHMFGRGGFGGMRGMGPGGFRGMPDRGVRSRGGRRGRWRRQVDYRDLDAPEEMY